MTATAARFRASCVTAFLALAAAPALAAQERPTLGPDDYGRWEQLGGAQLSPDGRWLAASVGRVNDEDELRIHGLAEKANQLDYQRRIIEWFAHYLKGEPAPAWIETGLGYLDQKDGVVRRRPVS